MKQQWNDHGRTKLDRMMGLVTVASFAIMVGSKASQEAALQPHSLLLVASTRSMYPKGRQVFAIRSRRDFHVNDENDMTHRQAQDDPPEPSFFDLIVGDDFVDETAAVEEVGGDPWFLPHDDGSEHSDRADDDDWEE